MLKRIAAILAVLITAVCIVGCQKQNDTMHTIEPPADGWTLETLNQVLYMNGQKIELPLMLSSLGDAYEIRDIEHYDETNRGSGVLYYYDFFYAIVVFNELDNDYQITTMSFAPAYYSEQQECSNYIKINGFGLNDSIKAVDKYLGDSYSREKGFIKYELTDQKYTILISDIEEDYMIMIFEGINQVEQKGGT